MLCLPNHPGGAEPAPGPHLHTLPVRNPSAWSLQPGLLRGPPPPLSPSCPHAAPHPGLHASQGSRVPCPIHREGPSAGQLRPPPGWRAAPVAWESARAARETRPCRGPTPGTSPGAAAKLGAPRGASGVAVLAAPGKDPGRRRAGRGAGREDGACARRRSRPRPQAAAARDQRVPGRVRAQAGRLRARAVRADCGGADGVRAASEPARLPPRGQRRRRG